jgi:hypothetical protein
MDFFQIENPPFPRMNWNGLLRGFGFARPHNSAYDLDCFDWRRVWKQAAGLADLRHELPLNTGGPVVYAPISLDSKDKGFLSDDSALAIARLQPGVSISEALAEARSLLAHAHDATGIDGNHLAMESLTHSLAGFLEKPLLALLGGVGILY